MSGTQSHFEINVSKRDTKPGWDGKPTYSHLFATAERSCVSPADMGRVHAELKKKFPAPSYQITVTDWQTRGYEVKGGK